jgi:uncharacterized damage-inducible protein DinB
VLRELTPIVELAGLHTRLVQNAFVGVSDDLAGRRPPGSGNSLAFLLCHLLDARWFTSDFAARPLAYPLPPEFQEARSADDIEAYPPLDSLLEAWNEVSIHLTDSLCAMSELRAREPSPHRFPVDDDTRLGGLTFLMSHEAYHIGQLGLIRRQLGLESLDFFGPAENGSTG